MLMLCCCRRVWDQAALFWAASMGDRMRRINVGWLALITVLAYGQFAGAASQFFPPKYYKVGSKNTLSDQVITADFNNDGVLDLAVANALSDEVSILLGRGDGTFGPPIIFSVRYPLAISAGDMNNDGKQDLIVLEYGGTGNSDVGIFLGDGTGHFSQHGAYQAGFQSLGLTAADFNGDGKIDVAVANFGNNGQGSSAMVFFGDGKGGLGSPKSYTLPGGKSGGPSAIAAGDLNGDHASDLVVGVIDGRKGHVTYMAVLLNDGSGKFTISGRYSAGGNAPSDIVIADLNGDGSADLAVASFDALAILLNKGNGKFQKTVSYQPCSGCGYMATLTVADFNRDGIPDVAVTGSLRNSLFYGKGKGQFKTPVQLPKLVGEHGVSLASGDFDNDGAPDLAISIDYYKIPVLINRK
jgi:hypothetical protein